MDAQRAMLDELMGAARNLTEEEKKTYREPRWDDDDVCCFFMVRFCPHDLFVNTRSDLGPCPKIHDLKLKERFEKSKRHDKYVSIFESRLARFCESLLSELGRKILRDRKRIMDEGDVAPPTILNEKPDQFSVLEEKLKKLLEQVEMLGEAGKVDEAEALMRKVDILNAGKKALTQQSSDMLTQEKKMALSVLEEQIKKLLEQVEMPGEAGKADEVSTQQSSKRAMLPQIKKMVLCEICGSLMTAIDAAERNESHTTGKQHIGYSLVRDFISEFKEKAKEERLARKKESEERRQGDQHEKRVSRRDAHGEQERYHSERERSHEWSRRGSDKNQRHHMNGRDWNHARPEDRNGVLIRDRDRRRSRSRSPVGHGRSFRRLH